MGYFVVSLKRDAEVDQGFERVQTSPTAQQVTKSSLALKPALLIDLVSSGEIHASALSETERRGKSALHLADQGHTRDSTSLSACS